MQVSYWGRRSALAKLLAVKGTSRLTMEWTTLKESPLEPSVSMAPLGLGSAALITPKMWGMRDEETLSYLDKPDR